MNLSDFCRRITGPDTRLLPENHKLGARLVCPEYSKSVQEVKTYPLLGQDRSFLLCWNFDSPGNLYATMMPSPENFCYHYSYSEGKYTQLHTHDYLELSYVVEGEFHQRILNKDVVFQKGDLCLIDKNCLHQDCLTDQSGMMRQVMQGLLQMHGKRSMDNLLTVLENRSLVQRKKEWI